MEALGEKTMSTPIRVLPIAPDEALVSVRKELGTRGTGILAWDRTRRILLLGQSATRIAAVIQRLCDAGVLDPWQHVHAQGIYHLLTDQIKSRCHKGWHAERVDIGNLAERLSQIRRSETFAQIVVATTRPACWEIVGV